MNRFEIPMNLKCKVCNNVAVYDCKSINKKICRFCCDKYQLSNETVDKCLNCDYLLREIGYKVKLEMGMMLSHEHKGKFIFDNDFESYHLKAVELYERLGVNTINEMFHLAIQYYYAHREQEALDLYNKIVNKNMSKDDKMKVYEKIGDVLLSLQRIDEAKEIYVKSFDYGNRKPKICRRLGEVYNILKDYGQSIHYHEKALTAYLSYEWSGDDDDFLYFTNYYSLAMVYSELGRKNKVIENAEAFLGYYGDFECIKERYFNRATIIGDNFMPESILSVYKLISLTYIELKAFTDAKDNILKARALSYQDVELAKVEGFIDGKLDSSKMELELEQLRQKLVEKDRAIMILIQSSENKSFKSFNSYNTYIKGDFYMGSKYHVENSGTIENQVFGDNVTLNNRGFPFKDIEVILAEISQKINTIGNEDTQRQLDEINDSIKNKKISGLKTQLSNLLVGVTAGCIANNIPQILPMISNVISKLK